MASQRPTGNLIEMFEKQAKDIRKLKRRLSGIGSGGIARWGLSGNQSIPSSTATVVEWDTVIKDQSRGDFSINLTTGVVTIHKAAWYRVAGGVFYGSVSDGVRRITFLTQNGNRIAGNITASASSGYMNVSTSIYCGVNDELAVEAFQADGASRVIGVNDELSHFVVERISNIG